MKNFHPRNYEEYKDIIESFSDQGVLLFKTYSTKQHKEVMCWIKPSKLLNLEEWN